MPTDKEDFRKGLEYKTNADKKVINFKQKVEERKLEEAFTNPLGIKVERYSSVEELGEKLARERRYNAQKGSANRANNRKRHRKLNPRFVALVLSAIAAGGAIGIANMSKGNSTTSLTQIIEEGKYRQLGISDETAEQFINQSRYFEGEDTKYISTQDLIELSAELSDLTETIVQEKMAYTLGCSAEDVAIYYGEDDEGVGYKIVEGKNEYNTPVVLHEKSKLNLIPDDRALPEEVSDTIGLLEDFDELGTKIENRKISQEKAMKKLEEKFNELDSSSGYVVERNEKGNLVAYDLETKQNTRKDNREER